MVLIAVLEHMAQKDTGFWYVDTHAGAGLYDLLGDWAQKRGEFEQGIGTLWNRTDCPALVKRYVERIKALNESGELRIYPGSPWLALETMRSQDRLRLFEWLGPEADILKANLSQQQHLAARLIKVEQQDGFAALKSVLPPPTRRAVTLIDPAYENKQDYRAVVQTVKDALTRFATGCYVVWYPRVNRLQAQQMVRQLEHLPAVQWLNVEMTVKQPPEDMHGLFGSGLWIANPPHRLAAELKQSMPWLVKQLAQDKQAKWHLRTSRPARSDPSR